LLIVGLDGEQVQAVLQNPHDQGADESAEHAAAATEQRHVMDMTRERELFKRRVDLDELLDGVLRRIDADHRLQVERDLSPRPFALHADPDQLERVFDNLLNNAAQAMRGEGQVVVRARTSAASDTISVIDHGPGVPEQVREHLFEPLRAEVRRHAFAPAAQACKIGSSELGDMAGVIGAAATYRVERCGGL